MVKLDKIAKISLEVEGGWNKQRTDLIPDGSVHSQDFSNSVCIGELLPPKPFDNLEVCLTWLKDNYPTEATNRCSIHSHISFHSLNSYNKLLNPDFYEYFLKFMKDWGNDVTKYKNFPITNERFWNRLEGKNDFCKKLFIPEKQLKITKKVNSDQNRYSHLNYCFGLHKTLECRLFPLFNSVSAATSAITAYVDCVETYLEKSPAIKEVIEEELSFEDDAAKSSDESVEVKTNLFKLKPFNLYEKRENIRPRRMTKDDMEKEIAIKKMMANAPSPARNRNFEEVININSPNPFAQRAVVSGYVAANHFEPVMLDEILN